MIILPSLEIVPAKYNGSTLLSQIPIDGTGDFTVTRATSPTTGQSTRVNALGQIELVADNVPRLDYPIGGGCPALLVEPAATNGIRNNSMVGASAPSNLPTNWSNQLGGGITQTIVGTGTENGVSYIDVRFSGTQTNTTPTDIRFESATQIAASNTQVWTESAWLKIVAAPNPPTDYRLYMFERDSGGGFIKFVSQVAAVTTTLTRFTFTRALDGGASVARVQPALTFTMASGSTYDFTIRIGYPQMETGSVATSVIPTTTQAITRAADVITDTTASGVIGQTQGTIYAEVDVSRVNTNTIISLHDGVGNNRFIVYFFNSTTLIADIRVATVNANYSVTIPAIPANGGIYKVALGYKVNDYCFALNGTIYASTASRGVPTTTQVNLGSNFLGASQLNDRIRAAALYTTRLTDTQLALLTSPYTSYSSMASALSYTLG